MPGLQAQETLATVPLSQLGDPDDAAGPFKDLHRLVMLAWADERRASAWLLARRQLEAQRSR